MTYKPSRDYLNFTGEARNEISNYYNQNYRFGTLTVKPAGMYSGYLEFSDQGITNKRDVITNPWGVEAFIKQLGITLAPGQSVNLKSGQLSDPNITPGLAKQLNANADFRAVNAAGLQAATATTARTQQSTLATMDQYYWGNQNSPTVTGTPLTGIDAIKNQGLQASNRGGLKQPASPTILGGAVSGRK